MVRVWAFVIALVAALAFAAWASDFVTMQGERTVYTAECAGGWQGDRCTGQVTAGKRYRYRALKPHGEVIFWTVGTSEPSGKFSDCKIQDGRNWVCQVCADASRSITLQMTNGKPVADASAVTLPYRAVSKWRWLLLQRGYTASRPVAPVRARPLTRRRRDHAAPPAQQPDGHCRRRRRSSTPLSGVPQARRRPRRARGAAPARRSRAPCRRR